MAIAPQQSKKKIFDMILDWMAVLAGLCLVIITLMVTYAAVMRYLNIRPPIWVLQYTEYGLLWITFLGAAWLQKLDGHIKIDTIINHLPQSLRAKLEIFNLILGCAVTLIIFYFATIHTVDLFTRGIMDVKATTIPKYLVFAAIPIGSFILLIQFMRDTWNKIRLTRTK